MKTNQKTQEEIVEDMYNMLQLISTDIGVAKVRNYYSFLIMCKKADSKKVIKVVTKYLETSWDNRIRFFRNNTKENREIIISVEFAVAL